MATLDKILIEAYKRNEAKWKWDEISDEEATREILKLLKIATIEEVVAFYLPFIKTIMKEHQM